MVYLNSDEKGSAWYASFKKNPDWEINKMKGVSKRKHTELMTTAVITPGI